MSVTVTSHDLEGIVAIIKALRSFDGSDFEVADQGIVISDPDANEVITISSEDGVVLAEFAECDEKEPEAGLEMNDELIRYGREMVKKRFLSWRDPPVELPADSVIEAAVEDVIRLVEDGVAPVE